MNPPHMVPMVELVAGELTSDDTMTTAETFYRDKLRRVTIRVKKEVVGHLANRLTSALYREAVDIVARGIGTVEDVDKAITYGPGMRWALMGPHLTYHVGGGEGGYRHYLDHLGPTQETRWQDLGTPELTDDLKFRTGGRRRRGTRAPGHRDPGQSPRRGADRTTSTEKEVRVLRSRSRPTAGLAPASWPPNIAELPHGRIAKEHPVRRLQGLRKWNTESTPAR